MKPYFAILPLVILLTACDSPQTEPKTNPILDPQVEALKKAQAVQGQVDAAAEAQRKQVEAAEQ